MATTEADIASRELIERVLARRGEAPSDGDLRAELERRISAYEARYGISSDRLSGAIDRGEIAETLDVCDWLMDVTLLRRVATAFNA
jgi:hypothetical protein